MGFRYAAIPPTLDPNQGYRQMNRRNSQYGDADNGRLDYPNVGNGQNRMIPGAKNTAKRADFCSQISVGHMGAIWPPMGRF